MTSPPPISLEELVLKTYPDYPNPLAIPDVPVRGLECDSRKIEKDFVFVAVRGKKLDGRVFIEEAARRGASAVVVDEEKLFQGNVPCVFVPECRLAASKLAGVFYGEPSKHMSVIGITGTNGKTTTSYLLEHLLQKENQKVGVIGTINYRFNRNEIPAAQTTPGPVELQAMLSQMQKNRCMHVVMEVSSHALDQNRTAGIVFSGALFTNLTQDHLDYHGSLENYFECKARLFEALPKNGASILNADDAWAMKLVSRVKGRSWTYGMDRQADFRAENVRHHWDSTEFDLAAPDAKKIRVLLPLMGRHNVYNALGALAMARVLGFSLEGAAEHLKDFPGVPGRLESVNGGQEFKVLVDFAHTPDGLENVLGALKEYRKRKLVVVFGCGGQRDKTKRPRMGEIAARSCDFVYVTSDNPRSEDPRDIAEQIQTGFPKDFKKYAIVLDRQKAIRRALMEAQPGDIVLLAGKGHEQTQVIGNQTIIFSDREVAERVLSGH
jgi:UDP-N-acetylmuramoyl-L-alanyl-D-glutamate--2,6-diaminopimelate ligase